MSWPSIFDDVPSRRGIFFRQRFFHVHYFFTQPSICEPVHVNDGAHIVQLESPQPSLLPTRFLPGLAVAHDHVQTRYADPRSLPPNAFPPLLRVLAPASRSISSTPGTFSQIRVPLKFRAELPQQRDIIQRIVARSSQRDIQRGGSLVACRPKRGHARATPDSMVVIQFVQIEPRQHP